MTVHYWYTDTISVGISIEQDSVEEAKQSYDNVIRLIGRCVEQLDLNVFGADVDAEPFNPDFVETRGE